MYFSDDVLDNYILSLHGEKVKGGYDSKLWQLLHYDESVRNDESVHNDESVRVRDWSDLLTFRSCGSTLWKLLRYELTRSSREWTLVQE